MVQAAPARRLLLTWSDRGIEGPAPAHHRERPAADRGPILRLLEHTERRHRYDRAVVLTVPRGQGPAQRLAAEMREHVPDVDVRQLAVSDPSDYAALFTELSPLVDELGRAADPWHTDVLLSAGTPQAQTLWVILVKAQMLRARMLQVIPAAFVPHPHPEPIREVRLDIEGFPEIRVLREEVVRLRAEARAKRGAVIAVSEPMRALMARVARVAPSELPVLITGETGAGKELIARAVHEGSPRAAGPFIAESCGALAESVLSSELFGHEAAAFTGATRAHRGLFEQAHGGTIFLDEVGELSPQVQAMLLRVLQERVIRRVGGERAIPVDVRVICATHRDLAQMVAARTFREDLYYRLSGVLLRVPSLRERTADLPAMIRAFQQEVAHGRGAKPLPITPAAMRAIAAYAWPGNVRQLRSEVHRWAVFCDHQVDAADLSAELGGGAPDREARDGREAGDAGHASDVGGAGEQRPESGRPVRGRSMRAAEEAATVEVPPLAETIAAAERTAIERALAACRGNLARTASLLGIQRNTLKRKLRSFGLYPSSRHM
jgi:two-component system, NtrC family, response regulator AtoC